MAVNNAVNTPYVIGGGSSYPTQHGLLIGNGTNAVSSTTLTDGQILIGSTGSNPSAATLTAGTGISITNGSGSITINSTAGSRSWTAVTSSTQTLTSTGGYLCNNGATLITFTLPSTASSTFGDSIIIVGYSSGGWKIAQNASQQIIFGNNSTTAGTGGYVTSGNQYDNVQLVFGGTLGGNGIWFVVDCVSAAVTLS